ncbi:MAG: nicotinate-nucleotide adenylyltransferase [Arenicella sp.]|jgi:nicotinate-nucleotide adenylyltransferase
MSKHIALLGGTFDPIHIGHLRMAVELRLAGFDEVRLIPNSVPPHRQQPKANAKQRLAMVQIACDQLAQQGMAGIYADDIELKRDQPSYSIATLELLRKQLPKDTALSWVMGDDAWESIHNWHRINEFLPLANLVIINRGHENQFSVDTLQAEWLKEHATELDNLLECTNGKLIRLNWRLLDVSATYLRSLLAQGQGAQLLTPDVVLNYIAEHQLYQLD